MNGFDPYAEWLGVPVGRRPPDYYELLGLARGESDATRIHAASVERTAWVRRYCLGLHGADATRLLGELGAAFACLSDPERKAAYDRQLAGPAGDVSADVVPPPIQRHVERSDEAPPRRFPAVERKTPAVGRSASWSRHRREVLSSGPARFTFAATIFLAATCGAVWFARRPPAEVELVGTYVAERPQPLVRAAISAEVKPPDRRQQAALPKTPPDAATRSLPPPAVNTESTANRDGPSVGDSKTAAEERLNGGAPTVLSADDANEVSGTGSGAPSITEPATSAALKEPPPTLAKKAEPPLAASAAPDKVPGGELANSTSSKSDRAAEQDRDARVLPPLPPDGQAKWSLSTGDDPEWLELTFDEPVNAAHIEILEASSPAMIGQVVIESEDGSTDEIKLGFSSYEAPFRRWSLGAKEHARTKCLWIRFRPTEDGVVELAGVAVLDRSVERHFPTLVRAVSKVSEHGKAMRATMDEGATPRENDGDAAEQVASVDAIEELARQELSKAREDRSRSIVRYVKLLGDKDYVNTKAAVEAVRDLEEIIASRPRTTAVSSARRALDRLVTHYPDSDAAKAASGVDRPGRGPPK